MGDVCVVGRDGTEHWCSTSLVHSLASLLLATSTLVQYCTAGCTLCSPVSTFKRPSWALLDNRLKKAGALFFMLPPLASSSRPTQPTHGRCATPNVSRHRQHHDSSTERVL